jgi:hypothetical protein
MRLVPSSGDNKEFENVMGLDTRVEYHVASSNDLQAAVTNSFHPFGSLWNRYFVRKHGLLMNHVLS